MQNKAIKDMNDWLDACLSHLPLFTKKEQLREELVDHFCDCLDAQYAKGYDDRAAMARALAALGDPDESGLLLRRVYRPWVGLFLWLARLALIGCLLLILINATDLRYDLETHWTYRQWYFSSVRGDSRRGDYPDQMAREGRCGGQGQFGEFQVTGKAAWTVWSYMGEEEWDPAVPYDSVCYVVLRIGAPPWYTPSEERLALYLALEDERGVVYRSDEAGAETNRIAVRYCGKDLGASYYLIWFLSQADPDRLELRYDDGVNRFTMETVFGKPVLKQKQLARPLEDEAAALARRAALFEWFDTTAWELVYARRAASVSGSAGNLTAELMGAGVYEAEIQNQWRDRYREFQAELLLRGPMEELPLSIWDLERRLRITDSLGNLWDWSTIPEGDSCWLSGDGTPLIYTDAGIYRIRFPVEEAADWYELRYAGEGEPLILRVELGEEEQP